MRQQITLEEFNALLKDFRFPENPHLLLTLQAPPHAATHGIPRLTFLLRNPMPLRHFRGGKIVQSVLQPPGVFYCAAGGYQWQDSAVPHTVRETLSFCYFGSYIRIVHAKADGDVFFCHTQKPFSSGGFALLAALEKLAAEQAPEAVLLGVLRAAAALTLHELSSAEDAQRPRNHWRWPLIHDYLREHRCENLSREEAARHFHISPGTLSRIVKANAGKDFCLLLLQYKLEFSRELLQYTMLSIGEIADQCGFQYASYFHRSFKKHFGISPGQWRRQISGAAAAYETVEHGKTKGTTKYTKEHESF